MGTRRVATEVFKKTHLVDWMCRRTHCTSPELFIDGQVVRVEIYPKRWFPLVKIHPLGSFRCLNPWGWPHIVLDHCKAEQKRREEMRVRLLALSIKAHRRKDGSVR